jgi:hypothetical protein
MGLSAAPVVAEHLYDTDTVEWPDCQAFRLVCRTFDRAITAFFFLAIEFGSVEQPCSFGHMRYFLDHVADTRMWHCGPLHACRLSAQKAARSGTPKSTCLSTFKAAPQTAKLTSTASLAA